MIIIINNVYIQCFKAASLFTASMPATTTTTPILEKLASLNFLNFEESYNAQEKHIQSNNNTNIIINNMRDLCSNVLFY